MTEPPYDCNLCRIEMADRLLDCHKGDITTSIGTFIVAMNSLAIKYNVSIGTLVREVMIELHAEHGGDDAS